LIDHRLNPNLTLSRAIQKRERNAKDAKGEAKSQLKVNEAAKTLKCMVCMQTFLQTAREPAVSGSSN